MITLCLHFGHDARISVLDDGVILCHYARGRHARSTPVIALTYTGIDYCGITTPQDVEYLIFDEGRFSFRILAGYGTAGAERQSWVR